MKQKESGLVRYAVVGLGHIAQVAALPAFKGAKRNSVLTALVTGDPKKARKVAKKYNVEASAVYSYEQYDELLKAGVADALYICLPNHLHAEYSIRALEAGLHVLCEKPLAENAENCLRIDQAAKKNNRRFMTAYRLHFEEANLDALKMVKKGKLGDLRYYSAEFSYQITDPDNIRLKSATDGGPVGDIGIYCINSARTLFQAEPLEVFAYAARRPGDPRFKEVPETVSVLMKFPNEQFANFNCSFGTDRASAFQLYGTKGSLLLENAFEYTTARKLTFRRNGEIVKAKKYPKADQFGPEILYFSDCILKEKTPEPGALEGMNDVKIIRAIHESAKANKPVKILGLAGHKGPKSKMKKHVPGVSEPALVNVRGASS